MHLLIPFSYCDHEACRQTLHTLKLPNLSALLTRLRVEPGDGGEGGGDARSLSPPHERALARALGLPTTDGLIPWAQWHARQQHLTAAPGLTDTRAWGFFLPCHWQLSLDDLRMSGPNLPELSEEESRALLATLQPFLQEDGITLHYEQPTRWLAQGDMLRELPSASLDRVLGQSLIEWMPRVAAATDWRRLQNEMQMLLYTHPVNAARQARGAPVINSIWLSGTGTLADGEDGDDGGDYDGGKLGGGDSANAPCATEPPRVADALRRSALAQDWHAWAQAWQALDAQECAPLLAQLKQTGRGTLTLCGQRQARSWQAAQPSVWRRLQVLFGAPASVRELESL